MKRVMVVEDSEDLSKILARKLERAAYAAILLRDGLEVISNISEKKEAPDAVILDLMLPGRSGNDLLSTIKATFPRTKIFIFSAHPNCRAMIPRGATEGFFLKTYGVERLIEALDKAVCD